ncbi:MAG TPA: universal stress protein [Gemmataceae bacterium]|jgi:nucleotide-binding universal stress UspA family protein
MLDFRTILHPTDFSEAAMYAFGLARALARDSGAELVVVHVAPTRHRPKRRDRRDAYEALRRLTAADPGVRMYPLLLDGDAASRIVRSAGEQDCDLIVMGTRGHTGLRRLLSGSVSATVRRDAPCPVVAVRLPTRDDWELPDFADGEAIVGHAEPPSARNRLAGLLRRHPDRAAPARSSGRGVGRHR